MFFNVFGSLLPLVTLLSTTYNNNSFRKVTRYFSNTTQTYELNEYSNSFVYQYDNSDTGVHSIGGICQGLGNGRDEIVLYSGLDSVSYNQVASIDWYFNVDDDGFYHLNVYTENYLEDIFNLKCDICFSFTIVNNQNSVVNQFRSCVSLNYCLNDLSINYTYVDENQYQYFMPQAVMNGFVFCNLSITYSPVSSVDFENANNEAYNKGYDDGYSVGYTNGESVGYTSGFNAGVSVDDTAIVIFNGILNIALVPINFFLAIFNFEILGINMSALVSSLLSICLIIIVVRFVTGKKQGGD